MMERLYVAYERDRHLIPEGNLVEISYEDLVADPKAMLRSLYRDLALGDFCVAEPGIDAYLAAKKDYRRNVFELDEDDRALVRARWKPYFTRFGYPA
jgi:omega-hydroxy-beta-dihydromenaquinone-9 sulfotransferase